MWPDQMLPAECRWQFPMTSELTKRMHLSTEPSRLLKKQRFEAAQMEHSIPGQAG